MLNRKQFGVAINLEHVCMFPVLSGGERLSLRINYNRVRTPFKSGVYRGPCFPSL